MAILLGVSGLAVLLVALVLFVRTSRQASESGATTNRRAVLVLTLLGLVLALASQLPIFQA
ncbi:MULTISPECIES: hypothetical protein [unclassified Microbacterium]|uniref:hypothetical protein n=1 Tax=unclassified Microbacterium TaxID=2609290 RepID=UPI00214B72C1|nr:MULTISPECIES: hypothetical protein [unclassified Microbacterium]MCR2783207.1 hypothetical protein [Microbacterium sp. zg.B96]MDL5352009.1 hypothetical protein [Microbacterium sp. zg-YB36]WIM15914.1 hypothetical protein QNO11_15510 [Microbacterium sp. zg-B96]